MRDILPTSIWIALIAMILLSAFLLMFDYWRRSRQRPAQETTPLTARRVLTREEEKLFYQIEERLPLGHRVLIQFPYSEMLEGGARNRFRAINTAHADLVIVDAGFNVVAVINYSEFLHADATKREHDRAQMNELQKAWALEEAGLPLLRIPAEHAIEGPPVLKVPKQHTNLRIANVLQSLLVERNNSWMEARAGR